MLIVLLSACHTMIPSCCTAQQDYFSIERYDKYLFEAVHFSYNDNVKTEGKGLVAYRTVHIDSNGLFEPSKDIIVKKHVAPSDMDKFDIKLYLPYQNARLVYEYRSGSIVPCRATCSCTRLTPIPGLKVLAYSDYYYQPSFTPVFNRPLHYFPMENTKIQRAKPPVPNIDPIHDQDLDMNDESVVPHARSPRYIPFDRKPPAADKLAYRRMGDHLYAGYFNQYGCFLWNARTDPIPLKDLKSEEILKRINAVKIDEPVYEFRSGSLVQGVINRDYYFVPEIGSTIESFRDYRQGTNPRRIYNLPGKFADQK